MKIIVAGGCEGWCVKKPPIALAEMYDPATDTWTKLPDLPFAISSAKMEQINGKPTIIGGYTIKGNEGLSESGKPKTTKLATLISYDLENKQWNIDGNLNIPRSTFAAIQIPKFFLPPCFNT